MPDPDVPDGGVPEGVDEAPIAPPPHTDAPVDTEASTRQAASRSVERGQGALVRNAAASYEHSQRYLESRVAALKPEQRDDPEVRRAFGKAYDDLQKHQWIDKLDDRQAVLEDFQGALDDALIAAAYEPEPEEEGPPPPGPEGAAETDEGTPAVPPLDDAPPASTEPVLAAIALPPLVGPPVAGGDTVPAVEAAPKKPRMSDARRGELTQAFILNGRTDARGRSIPKDAIKPDVFKQLLGEDLNATDQRGKEKLKSAVLAKQGSLNEKLKAAGKATIKTDGIFGPETYAAILEIDKETADTLKGLPAAPPAAPAAPAVAAEAPAALKEAPAIIPPVSKLPPFPTLKEAPPALLTFDRDKFYKVNGDITDLPERERGGLKADQVVYLVETRADGEMIVEKTSGQKVAIHTDYLDHLDPDTDVFDDREAKDSYVAARLQVFGKDKEHLPNIQRDDIRKIDDTLVCISKTVENDGNAGAGLTAVIDADGNTKNVKTAKLEKVEEAEKDQYIIARLNAADAKVREEFGRTISIDVVTIRTPRSPQAIAEGKKQYARVDVPVTKLKTEAKVIFISDKTGKEYPSDVVIGTNATVAVLGETADGTKYKIATEAGIVGYIEKNKAGVLAAKTPEAPPSAPTVAVAA